MALPEVLEVDHHGFPSFRVRGKIFATLPEAGALNAMVDPELARAASGRPACEELWWGSRLAGLRVALAEASKAEVARLLRSAWEHKAPASLVRRTGPGRRS